MAYNEVPYAIATLTNLNILPVEQHGVYFLCEGSDIVYVGQSVAPYSRVKAHKVGGKKFDRVYLLHCLKSEMDIIESEYIHMLRPKLNGEMCTGEKVAPIREADMP